MLVLFHVVIKNLLAWMYRFICVTMYFGDDEVNMEGKFGVMRCVCD